MSSSDGVADIGHQLRPLDVASEAVTERFSMNYEWQCERDVAMEFFVASRYG